MERKGLRALLIEDNPGDARLLRELLREAPTARVELEHASTLADGLAALDARTFDVLLLDLSLPDSFGVETLQRASAAAPGIPIVVLTGTDDQTLALRAVAEGAQDYLVKRHLEPELLVRSLCYSVERKRIEEQLVHSAYHDALTGLPNRAGFHDQIERALAHFSRRKDYHFAVLFIDLDGFKHVNDSLGHQAGDQLLMAVAKRVTQCLRAGDAVGRLGGDEFTLLLDDIRAVEDVTIVAERILASLTQPFEVKGHDVFTGASIGIAVSSTTYSNADEMLRDADIAMYRAKHLGKGRYEIFNSEMHVRAVGRLRLETDLRRALERNEFLLHFQPIVSLVDQNVLAFEALVRWRHPERGMIAPGEFIEVAEQAGLIVSLGKWVLKEACQWLLSLDSGNGLVGCPSINVNLSARQFGQLDLLKSIRSVLHETGLEASRLNLEVTESAVMEDPRAAAATLGELRALGVRVYIDDFGTGHSSLSYLSRFPIDVLKIDRSFVAGMSASPEDAEIVRAIVALARAINVDVIAEGVETLEQAGKLRELGCESAQGYLFSRPLPPEEAQAFLVSRRRLEIAALTEEGVVSPTFSRAVAHVRAVHACPSSPRPPGRQRDEEWAAFAHAVVNALQPHISVVDSLGVIVAVNQAWIDFADANPPAIVDSCVGANYLAVCERATGPDSRGAREFAVGMWSVLSGLRREFSMEYPCHSPTEQRWFIGRVTRLAGGSSPYAVISHENITDRKLAEITVRNLNESISRARENTGLPVVPEKRKARNP